MKNENTKRGAMAKAVDFYIYLKITEYLSETRSEY